MPSFFALKSQKVAGNNSFIQNLRSDNMKTKELVDYIIEKGGATIKNGELVEYSSGYQVAQQSGNRSVSKKDLRKTLQQFNKKYTEFGVCYNKITELYEFDVCQRINDLVQALQIGKAENQREIWDWENSVGIIV